ncbi:MAG: sugar ABC transporter permease [Thermoprotei archaeon]|nr:MAG: sugar ABC transporter permease [Thermoprotei archaeon]
MRLRGGVLLIPALLMVFLFVIFPALWGVIISFTGMSLIGVHALEMKFIGLKNYIKLLNDPDFFNSLRVSFLFTAFSALVGQAFLGLFLALLFRLEGIRGKSLVAVVVFLAWIIPEVVAGYTWGAYAHKHGLLNTLLSFLGIRPINWLYKHPLETAIIANIWRGTAFSMILFSAALESIPNFLYEAAEVDGATGWQRFRSITLPLISHVIIIDYILITIWTFSVFTLIFVMTGRGVGGATELWTIFTYYRGFQPPYEISYAAASASLMFLIVLALIFVYLFALRRVKV